MQLRTLAALAVFIPTLSACGKPLDAQANKAPAVVPMAAPAGVTAAPGSAEANAIAAVRKLNPTVVVDGATAAPIAGFRQLVIGGRTVYVSDDGKYLIQGSIYDLGTKRDLSEQAVATMRHDLLAKVPQSERIVFAPANPKYTVSVFTDIECGFCRKLHSDIAAYNAQGIAIEYLAFPRAGLGTPDARTMEAVWCSADRRKALTDAKNGKTISAPACSNPVAAQYALGQRVGLTGTPMIVAPNGVAAPGYLPPAQLKEWLDTVVR